MLLLGAVIEQCSQSLGIYLGIWAELFHRNALGDFQLDTTVFTAGIVIISGVKWLKLTIPRSG